MVITIISFLFILGVLVIAHELGHLLAAKRLNIKVEAFSIGLGPRIIGIRRGDTDYILSLFPLGGYVKLSEEPPKRQFYPLSPNFCERPPIDKIVVTFAGPVMNLLFAFILLLSIYFIGVKVPVFIEEPPTIGWVQPDSSGQRAGLQSGDRIVAVNNAPIATWGDLLDTIALFANKPIELKVSRGRNIIETTLLVGSQGEAGFYPAGIVSIKSIVKDSPAEKGGLQIGDKITAVNQQPISNWNQFVYLLQKEETETLTLEVLRGNQRLSLEVHPEKNKNNSKRFIGISYQPQEEVKRYGLFSAAMQGFLNMKEIIIQTFQIIWKLVTGEISIKVLGGPIMIAQVSGDTAQRGLIPLLSFMAFLSIQLGLLNLLPFIPIVDGGQITFYIFEIFRKRPVQMVTLERASKVGWAAMISLFLIITYNDIMRLI